MPILQWHDSVYALGVELIDRQHRRLVELINRAYDAVLAGGDAAATRQIVGAMSDYAREHFSAEEGLMAEAGYDRLEPHRGAHAFFAARVEDYVRAVESGAPPSAETVFRFLADWLSAHILELDMAFGRFLRQEGTAAAR